MRRALWTATLITAALAGKMAVPHPRADLALAAAGSPQAESRRAPERPPASPGTRWWSHVEALANDGMEGRNTDTPAHKRAAEYVAAELEKSGMKSMIVWVLKDNPACEFYRRLGGQPVASKMTIIEGTTLEEVAFGWSDLGALLRPAGRP